MAESDPTQAGLGTRQPFAAPGHGFFPGGGRKTHLEQLRHLSQWSRRVLVVTGPRGVGKSTLYRHLSATLEPRAKAARINAALVGSASDVLHAMVQGFGIAAPPDADVGVLAELISGHAQEQERSERFCIAMVDDAELLETRALDLLVNLAATAPLRVVLFGEVRVVPAVERAANASSASWHEIRLVGFDAVDVREYLVWRFRNEGQGVELPFSDAEVKEIARLSEGLPGRVDQMANVLLARIRSAGQEARQRRFPLLHRALLAVLAVAVGFAYLVWQPAREGRDLARVERLEVPPAQPRPASNPDQPRAAEQSPVPPPGGHDLSDDAADAGEAAAPAAAEPDAESPAAAPSDEIAAEMPSAAPPDDGGDDDSPVNEPPVAEPPAPSQTTPAPAAEQQPESGPRGATWIMNQPASAYTLQLVTFSTPERASAFLSGHPDLGAFAQFRQQRDGRIQHVVIYGSFETRAAAEQAAAAGLPGSSGRLEPWIRTFGDVQDAARTALQQ